MIDYTKENDDFAREITSLRQRLRALEQQIRLSAQGGTTIIQTGGGGTIASQHDMNEHQEGSPTDVGSANSEGVSSLVPRSDHVHKHPDTLDADLHHNASHDHTPAAGLGTVSHSDLDDIVTDDHHTKYTDGEARTALRTSEGDYTVDIERADSYKHPSESTARNSTVNFPFRVEQDYNANYFYPLLGLHTDNNNPTKTKVGIYARLTGLGAKMYFGISDDYGVGVNQIGLIIDENGDLNTKSGTNINEFSTDGTLAGDSDSVLPTEKAVKTYVDNELDKKAFSLIYAPENGAIWGALSSNEWLGAGSYFPSSDSDARFSWQFRIPDNASGTFTLKIIHASNGSGTYSGVWDIGSYGDGETPSSNNILNASTANDFTNSSTANLYSTKSITLSGVAGGDIVTVRFQSDASNARYLMIHGIWVEW